MKLQILDAARDDLIAGYDFYEVQEPSLGDYFISCLYSDIESLRIYGGIHRLAHGNLHRALSKRFPFAIYYAIAPDKVVVHAHS
jgi:hypothetical protein